MPRKGQKVHRNPATIPCQQCGMALHYCRDRWQYPSESTGEMIWGSFRWYQHLSCVLPNQPEYGECTQDAIFV